MKTNKPAPILIAATVLTLWLPLATPAATFVTETFEGGAHGWSGSGDGITVDHTAAMGSSSASSMQGAFDDQGMFYVPQTGYFEISSGLGFMGSYAGLTGFTFDFYAQDMAPADLSVRIWSGGTVFFYALNAAALGASWHTFTVPLTYSAGWQVNNDEAGFNSVLGNVTMVQVGVTRGSSAAQTFFLDNFGTLNTPFEAASSVPEPSTGLMVLYFGAILLGIRKRSLEDWVDGEEAT